MDWRLRRRTTTAVDEERRRQERAAREARRQQGAARRRQVTGQFAAAALSWSLAVWIEGAMWFCLFLGLVVLYIGSYTDLAATFGAFGYDPHISWLMPLGIDLPVTASVLGQLLAGRWRCGWWVRVRLGILTASTAPLTLAGNALRGAIDGSGHFTFPVQLWMDLAAFAVPGLGVVLIGWVASMMQGERAELTRRRLEAEAEAAPIVATAGADMAPAAAPFERRQRAIEPPRPEPGERIDGAGGGPGAAVGAASGGGPAGAADGVVVALRMAPQRRRTSAESRRRGDPRLARLARLLERARERGEPEPTNGELAKALATSETTARRLRSRLEQAAAPAAAAEEV